MLGNATTIKEALVDPPRLAIICQELESGKTQLRTELASAPCQRFGFLDTLGKPLAFSCLKALRELEGAGHFQLPPRKIEVAFRWKPRRLPKAVPLPKGVPKYSKACMRRQPLLESLVAVTLLAGTPARRVRCSETPATLRPDPSADRALRGRQ